MANTLLNKFDQRINKLKADKRQRFLHGVYKQLAVSHKGRLADGEYGEDYRRKHPESEERIEFIVNFADALNRYGLENHANRLLRQERRAEAYQRWKHTLNELEKIEPELSKGVELHFHISGIQLYIHDPVEERYFNASVILNGISYGREDNLYEICPIFEGKGLEQYGHKDNVLGHLNLQDALSVAKSVRNQDRERYDDTLQRVIKN